MTKAKKKTIIESKSENKQAVYRFIHAHSGASRQDICQSLGLSLPTVNQVLAYLGSEQLIYVSDTIRNTGGRNAAAYSISGSGRTAMGIFLAPQHMTAVCVDLNGKIIYKERLPVKLDIRSEAYLKQMGELAQQTLQNAKVSSEKFIGVGITLPGLVSRDGESVLYGLTEDLAGITRSVLAKYIPYPTKLFHDSSAAGFAEVWGRSDIDNAVYLNLNSSIGGAVIIGNKTYKGKNQRAGEFGHMILYPKTGKRCYCGHKGCFYTVGSADVLSQHTKGNLAKFFTKLQNGDKSLQKVWNTYLDDLALALHNIKMLYDCDIILGGYVGSYIEAYMEQLCAKVDALNVYNELAAEYVLPCRYKNEATAAGCAIEMIEQFINSL